MVEMIRTTEYPVINIQKPHRWLTLVEMIRTTECPVINISSLWIECSQETNMLKATIQEGTSWSMFFIPVTTDKPMSLWHAVKRSN